MNLTTDYELIRAIISRADIMTDFCGGREVTEELLMGGNIIYFHDPDVGLFPANMVDDKTLIVHAAIPRENRGRKAIKAARDTVQKLCDNGYKVLTQIKDIPKIRVFVRLIGFEFLREVDGMRLYIFKGARNG